MQKIFFSIGSLLLSILVLAQEKSADIDVDINKDGGSSFMSSPWMWVVGGALFILLLVALTRGGGGGSRNTTSGSGDKVTVTKTVERDTTTDL